MSGRYASYWNAFLLCSIISESIVFVIYLCFKMYFPIGYHCTISLIKQNSVLFIHRDV